MLAFDIRTSFFNYSPSQQGFDDAGHLISHILPNVIIFAGVLFMALIIYGGFHLIIYGGQYNSPARVSQSKNMITYGLIGFLLVVSAYFILQMVSYITGINFINVPI